MQCQALVIFQRSCGWPAVFALYCFKVVPCCVGHVLPAQGEALAGFWSADYVATFLDPRAPKAHWSGDTASIMKQIPELPGWARIVDFQLEKENCP